MPPTTGRPCPARPCWSTCCRAAPNWEATRRHGQHVAHLAEQLFDQLQPLHGLDGRWLYRLRIACCLHDIGFASGRKGHHKKGMRIVEQDTSLALLPKTAPWWPSSSVITARPGPPCATAVSPPWARRTARP